ncbi:MAG: glycosyltransferase family 2 protein [Clostridiales bacterium]|nr:glycosyltransferase family 2 protein [Clostridiales bacterium]
MEKKKPTVAVLIPTYRPDQKFLRILKMLQRQTYPVKQLIIINTEEAFWNQEKYEKFSGMEVHHITREAFDHGGTRRQGMRYVRTDICICMTQDAVPADEHLVEYLVAALTEDYRALNDPVAVAYARQLPRRDCGLVERYTRSFNYPARSMVKTADDLPKLGIKTWFCSNVCAAYNMEIYDRLDGFVERAIFNEDMLYAAQMIDAGYAIAYAAKAQVIHSHNYTCRQQFRRNFDLAVSQAEHPEVFAAVSSESEGIRLVKMTFRYLMEQKKPWLVPGLVMQSGAKYLGYRLGKNYRRLPRFLILRFTMNRYYWKE